MPEAPQATPRPTSLRHHDDERVDPYYWLRERDDPEVIAYLEAENAYTEASLAHTKDLQRHLFEEFKSRIQETDEEVPARKGDYWYYARTVEGLQYGIHCRRQGRPDGAEEVLLDENMLAGGRDFFALGAFVVSPDHALAAFSTDYEGSEVYTLRVRDVTTGEDLPDEVPNTYYGVAWGNDNGTVFYTVLNRAMRPWQVWRHRLGTAATDDTLVYQEDDERFHVSIHRTRSDAYLLIRSGSMVTTEYRYLPAAEPLSDFTVVEPRRQGIEYEVDHHGDHFFVVTNDAGPNFRLVRTPVAGPGASNWEEVVAHRDDVKLDGVSAFSRHLVLSERAEGLRRIRVMPLAGGDPYTVDQPETVYTALPGPNLEFDTNILRYQYQSMVTPRSVFDYDMDTRERTLRKEDPVLGGYDRSQYATERLWATADDGVRVPISVVYRKGLPRDGSAPCVLYGYGSYEASTEPRFSHFRLSLLDRGLLFAIGHVRGGGEMGRLWYEHGKLLEKRNTFTDFVACAEHLAHERWTSPERLAIRGGSAGGLLVGAAVNLRPDLFKAVVAEVPFVDALTTILDESLPLTAIEWEEWGNPVESEDVYHYMKSYAPVDNVEAKDYPHMLVTAGLNDPRVSYWEPAKWVAKLRATKTDDNRLLLKTEMGAGHMGPSGRYEQWKDEALVYAFVLDTLGVEG